ncbi:hypothetical protein NEUTE1DRAFT_81548 [Neurospora tetrasperma FGSC 2508]|uniref:Integral membrane protein n=1 Tax=Neurospora tetrasperma (strain FGSC 2508 / ATCC MYA-4615 / P0657) TaxID=510951 RepID=F8MM49_NEUT8|nr:uncharacterized protein NEUTE1DRAFT_81548 [Neurospora tetrasperma FGSC 2508]EGO57723.1 hypothetical protein NEUTE1DRAFT_81548 [Neurospora tetrasperma FGSC 2508]
METAPSAMETRSIIRKVKPVGYVTPPFPSLHWPPQRDTYSLYDLEDMWRFTLLWTLIIYGLVHLGAAGIALMMQVGKKKSNWKFLWLVPLLYAAVAGAEALLAGCLVGLVVGATYKAGAFSMSTWIPFIWGWVNVLILILSSFRIQGGL